VWNHVQRASEDCGWTEASYAVKLAGQLPSCWADSSDTPCITSQWPIHVYTTHKVLFGIVFGYQNLLEFHAIHFPHNQVGFYPTFSWHWVRRYWAWANCSNTSLDAAKLFSFPFLVLLSFGISFYKNWTRCAMAMLRVSKRHFSWMLVQTEVTAPSLVCVDFLTSYLFQESNWHGW